MANDAHISGSGRISSGEYNEVHISGSGQWNGPVRCQSFHVSGSCRGEGPLTVLEDLHCAGSLRSKGTVDAKEISVSGSARIEGNVAGREEVHISGSLRCNTLYGGDISISGGLNTQGDVEADRFRMAGGGEIKGLLNAEEIDISIGFQVGSLKIGQIGGSEIRVRRTGGGLLSKLFAPKSSNAAVVTSTIEGDEIDLTSVAADVVRGKDIIIRGGCRIGKVEYSGDLTILDGAEVGEQVKVG